MTVVTVVTAGNMRRRLARGRHTVVTGTARTEHLGMVDCIRGRPDIGIVAILADAGRLDVRQVFPGGSRPIVATGTVARNVRVIETGRTPCHGGVAIIAIAAARDMRRRLSGGDNSIVTRVAGSDYLCVVYCINWRKDVCRMAVLANIRRLDMGRCLAGCFRAVVAIDAITGDIYVIEVRRQPAGGRVTVVAGIAARDMRWCLARRRDAIVTIRARPDDLRVIDGIHGRERIGIVAILADAGCLDMCRDLAGRLGSVVTTRAIVDDVHMIEVGGQPTGCCMAVVTVVTARNVRRRLAGRRYAVVAGAARPQDLRVIDREYRCPDVGRMAILADVRRLNMRS